MPCLQRARRFDIRRRYVPAPVPFDKLLDIRGWRLGKPDKLHCVSRGIRESHNRPKR